MIEIAGIPRSTYYYYVKHRNDEDKYFEIKEEISSIYTENKGRYGYRRITKELHNRGFVINHKTVQKLMKQLNLVCKVRMKKYKSYKGEVGKVAPNLLERDFVASKPNEKWVTDVTEFSVFDCKIYLSPILDLYSGDIVSYTISEHPKLSMVTEMLDIAFEKIPDNTNIILHSDQGWHYQHKRYQKMLVDKGIQQSMGHSDSSVTKNYYYSISKSDVMDLSQMINLNTPEIYGKMKMEETGDDMDGDLF